MFSPCEFFAREVADCVRLSFDEPLAIPGPGRPRSQGGMVKKLAVFQEAHSDGTNHYHVAVRLNKSLTFGLANSLFERGTTLPRTSPATARSSGAQSVMATAHHGQAGCRCGAGLMARCQVSGWDALDLFAESQRPWNADIWKKRKEEADMKASGASSAKRAKFNNST